MILSISWKSRASFMSIMCISVDCLKPVLNKVDLVLFLLNLAESGNGSQIIHSVGKEEFG